MPNKPNQGDAMKPGLVWLLSVVACLCAVPAHAATMWNEAVSGDLSNDGLAPTALTMNLGSNQVLGFTGNSGQGINPDYFKFTVPANAALTSITLLGNTSISGSVSFIGIAAG